jgi:hypothetical protein
MFSWLLSKPKSHQQNKKHFPDWNLLDALDVRLGNAIALTLSNQSRRYDYRKDLTNYILVDI